MNQNIVVVQDGIVVDYPPEVEVVDLNLLEEDPDEYYSLGDDAQQYVIANYPELLPDDEKEKAE